jgi:hypothetical protein
MSGHYHQKALKDLYPAKDVMFAVVGVLCTIGIAVVCARYFSSLFGI